MTTRKTDKPRKSAFGDAVLKDVSKASRTTQEVKDPGTTQKKAHYRPGREGKSLVGFYVGPEAHKQLKRLCLDLDSDIQNIMTDHLNDLFRKHGLPQIA